MVFTKQPSLSLADQEPASPLITEVPDGVYDQEYNSLSQQITVSDRVGLDPIGRSSGQLRKLKETLKLQRLQ